MENEKNLEYVNQLVFAECMKEEGGDESYSTLVNLMMLGGSPDVLLFSLLISFNNYVYDENSLLYQVLQPYFYESFMDRYKRSGMLFEYSRLLVLQNHTLANITLTKRVLDLFKANNINQDTTGYVGMNMRIGMTPLDFLLDVRERNANSLSEQIKNGIDPDYNEEYRFTVEDADLGIEILLENSAKPTPTYLLYLMKEGKDCSIIQEQIEKMS